MNLVEISEMLKGAPDTYLTQHIQSPDGSVPQYLALAELQRRQDMRARFAQQNPQTTVADDAIQGIAAAAPGMMPPQGAAPMPQAAPPPQGFAKGGEVKDTTLDQILYRLGIRNLPSEKSAYEDSVKQAQRRLSESEAEVDRRTREHARRMQQGALAEEDAARKLIRNKMDAGRLGAMMEERQRVSRMSPEELLAMEKAEAAALADENMEWLRQRMIEHPEEFEIGPGPSSKTSPRPPLPAGYKEGGLVEQYIKNAGRFESGNNSNAKNPFSSASGRFQFIDSTRRRLDKKYGFDPKDRSDETERARMEAYTNETIQALESANIPVTGGTLYGGHFLGQGGIKKFFEAYRKDPTTNVSEHFSAEIIRKNPAIFNPRGGKARTTLAEVMEKFDKVGGGRQRTPMTDEDMNMGAAIQVANRADRGDIGPYEDMNLAQASALAQLLEKSKLGEGPMVGYPQTQREPAPSFFHNPMGDQIKAQLLERYTNPGIAGGVPGFNQGGMVKGYSGADGVSSVSSRRPEGHYRYNPVTGQLEVDPNAPPYMPNMMAVDRGEVVPEFEYTDAELARQFGGGGKSITKDAKDSISPQSKNYDPMWGTAFLMNPGDMPPDVVTGSAEKHREFLRSKKENKKDKKEKAPAYTPGKGFMTPEQMAEARRNKNEELRYKPFRKFAEGAEFFDKNLYQTGLKMIPPTIGEKDFMGPDMPLAIAAPYNLGLAGYDVAKSAGGLGIAGLGALGTGAMSIMHSLTGSGPAERRSSSPATTPSKFFYTPESAASTGGSGILGGAGIELPPAAPNAQPTAEEVAAAGQRMREEAGALPVAPAAAPPASKFDAFADQFLQELRDAKMSKEEMRQTALLQAGLGMMTGTSPNFLANVGQGAMAGLQAYQQAKAQNQALASEAYKNIMAARALGLDERRVAAAEMSAASEAKYRNDLMAYNRDKLSKALTSDPAIQKLSSSQWNYMNKAMESLLSIRSDNGEPVTIDDVKNITRQLRSLVGETGAAQEDESGGVDVASIPD